MRGSWESLKVEVEIQMMGLKSECKEEAEKRDRSFVICMAEDVITDPEKLAEVDVEEEGAVVIWGGPEVARNLFR